MDVQIRSATTGEADARFLREMLYAAAAWRPDQPSPPFEDVVANPRIAIYVKGWGRAGDCGLIAEADGERLLGAAWYRLFGENEHSYGFIDGAVPEITIGVRADARGRGVGTTLLQGLIERARDAGFPAVSLSVEEDNPALRLYKRLGFVPIGRVENAWTMRRDLNKTNN